MKYPQKYGKQRNSTTYCSDTATLYTARTQQTYGQRGCILAFLEKGDLRIAKNYRGIIITSIVAKIYYVLLPNCIEPEIKKILWKNQNAFRRKRSISSQILTIWRSSNNKKKKKPLGDTIICKFLQGIWLHTQSRYRANTYIQRSP